MTRPETTFQIALALRPDTRLGRREARCRYDLHRTLRAVCPPDTDTETARLLYRVVRTGKEAPTPLLVQSPAAGAADWPSHLVPIGPPKPLQCRYEAGARLRFQVELYPVRRNAGGEHPLPAWAWKGYLARQLGRAGAALLRGRCEETGPTPAKGGAVLTTCRCTGTLAVADPERFAEALAGGIGRGKAWGLGLLTVRESCLEEDND